MRIVPLLAALAAAASLLGCGESPAPPPEFPEPVEPDPASDREQPPPLPEEHEVEQAPPRKDNTVPDDYSLMRGDCVQLGKQLAALTRSDQAATLSPKLSAQQRAQAEKSINGVATKLGDQYAEGCEKNLVGQVVDPQSLKCAFNAKTVKEFDQCLNGPAQPK